MKTKLFLNNKEFILPIIKCGFFNTLFRDDKIIVGVYIILNCLHGDIYVGSSNNVARRVNNHRTLLQTNKHSIKKLQDSYNRTDKSFFDLSIIFTSDREEAFDVEQYILDLIKNDDRRTNIATNSRKSMLDRTLTDEQKEKLRFYSTGRIFSKESKEKIAIKATGRSPSLETRRKISIGNKGKIITPEMIERVKLTHTGRKNTLETIKKMSEAKRGKKALPETIAKLRLNNHKRYKPISINGVVYKGVREAGRILNIDNNTICYRLKNNNNHLYKDYIYV